MIIKCNFFKFFASLKILHRNWTSVWGKQQFKMVLITSDVSWGIKDWFVSFRAVNFDAKIIEDDFKEPICVNQNNVNQTFMSQKLLF